MIDSLKNGSEVAERLQNNFKDILEDFAVYTLVEELQYGNIGKVGLGYHQFIE